MSEEATTTKKPAVLCGACGQPIHTSASGNMTLLLAEPCRNCAQKREIQWLKEERARRDGPHRTVASIVLFGMASLGPALTAVVMAVTR